MVAQIHAKRAQDIVHKENRKSANDYLTQTILFSFLLLIVIYVHKPWGLRFFLYRVLSALLLTSVFSAEVQAVEDFIPAGHKGLR